MDALVIPAVVGLLISLASVIGKGEELCKGMEGKWTPAAQSAGGDVCPGGHLYKLFTPAPKPVK